MSAILEALERVLDAIPRAQGARVADVGEVTLFLRDGAGWPWYGRPRERADFAAAREALQDHGAPEVFEWVHDRTPSLARTAGAAGLAVRRHPLLVLRDVTSPPLPAGVVLRDDHPLDEVLIAQAEAFGGGADLSHLPAHREALADGRAALLAAVDDAGQVLGVAMAQRAAGGAELVGIATVEHARGRGISLALTAALARRLQDADPVFLSAGDDATARVYERAGFVRVGETCAAEPVS